MSFGKGCCLLGAVLLLVLQHSTAIIEGSGGVEDTPCDWPTGQQYWPHPTNCHMFVQCAPYGPQEMHCAPGTAWSQALLTCDHEAKTGCEQHPPPPPPSEGGQHPSSAPPTEGGHHPSPPSPTEGGQHPSSPPPTEGEQHPSSPPPTEGGQHTSPPPPPDNEGLCPSPYKLRGTECFFVHEDKDDLLDWDESRQRCLSMGGDLAQPQDMVDFVEYIKERYSNNTPTIWLGATDRAVEQDWYWVTGEAVPAAMWKPWPDNQPSGDGNCMEIHYWPHKGFYMNDWHCHNKGYFACEFNMASTS